MAAEQFQARYRTLEEIRSAGSVGNLQDGAEITCGVLHGHRSTDAPSVLGGFASPPQLDLLLDADLYRDGAFAPAAFQEADLTQIPGLVELHASSSTPGSAPN
jgi:hypothetical protein